MQQVGEGQVRQPCSGDRHRRHILEAGGDLRQRQRHRLDTKTAFKLAAYLRCASFQALSQQQVALALQR
jgi:hypothetical protein